MNIDLLTKLVKLANHNPNENEANLAARKVCKIIEESNFKFNNTIIEEKQTFDYWQKHSNKDAEDYWKDVRDILNKI